MLSMAHRTWQQSLLLTVRPGEVAQATGIQIEKLKAVPETGGIRAIPTHFPSGIHHAFLPHPKDTREETSPLNQPPQRHPLLSSSLDGYR